jgi:septum formation protein
MLLYSTRIQNRLIIRLFLLIYVFLSPTLTIQFSSVFAFSTTNKYKFSNQFIGTCTCTSCIQSYRIHRSLSQLIPIWNTFHQYNTNTNIRIPTSQQLQYSMLSSSSSSSNAATTSSSTTTKLEIDAQDDDNDKTQPQQSRRPEFVLSVKEYLYHHHPTTSTKEEENNSSSCSNSSSINNDNIDSLQQQINTNKIQFILASQSPRRKEILDMMGLQNRYTVIPSPLNETFVQNLLRNNHHNTNISSNNNSLNPMDYVRTLAEQKAYAVAYDLKGNINTSCTTLLILGSDTIVVLTTGTNNTIILEKPKDQNDAMQMLQSLQGRSHQVYTGVALIQVTINKTKDDINATTTSNNNNKSSNNRVLYQDGVDKYKCINQNGDETTTTRTTIRLVQSFVECTTVYMSQINNNDILSYITKTNESYDKAGAYGIQGIGGQYITKIDGDFFNVRCFCFFLNIILCFF